MSARYAAEGGYVVGEFPWPGTGTDWLVPQAERARHSRRADLHHCTVILSRLSPVRSYPECMGSELSLIEAHREQIADTVRRHRGRSVAVFGSVARDEDTDSSDVDFLVEFEDGSSLFDLLHLQDELSALLGCGVDVVSTAGLKDRDDHIRREAINL